MSRIGKQPVPIPDKVKVDIKDHTVRVEGPKGKVSKTFAPVVKISLADKKVVATAPVRELEHADHPWIREYFLGPRGRAVGAKAKAKTEA